MKSTIKLLMTTAAVVLAFGSLTSCKDNKLHEKKGVVTYIDSNSYGDTIRSMKVLVDGTDTVTFNMFNTRYNNGVMIDGDSVTVYYTKMKSDTLRAELVYTHIKPSKQVDLDSLKNNKILTR